ncbi:hypothetical protein ACJW30_03G034000 [Castanea mollissima]
MVVGIDDNEHNTYALEWTLDHFFAPYASNHPFKLVLVHSKATPSAAIGLAGPGAAEVLPLVDADLKKITARVVKKARELCSTKSVIQSWYVMGRLGAFNSANLQLANSSMEYNPLYDANKGFNVIPFIRSSV